MLTKRKMLVLALSFSLTWTTQITSLNNTYDNYTALALEERHEERDQRGKRERKREHEHFKEKKPSFYYRDEPIEHHSFYQHREKNNRYIETYPEEFESDRNYPQIYNFRSSERDQRNFINTPSYDESQRSTYYQFDPFTTSQPDPLPFEAPSKMYPSSSNDQIPYLLTEAQLLSQLSSSGKATYYSLDHEGRGLALQLASHPSYTNKDFAVSEAKRRLDDRRRMAPYR